MAAEQRSLTAPPPPPAPREVDLATDPLTVEVDPRRVIDLQEPSGPKPPLGRDFTKLWFATAISNIGDGARLTALPLLAATVTRNPIAVAALLFSSKLPWLFFSLHAGAVADRADRRRLIVSISVIRGLVMAVLAVAALTGMVSLPLLYIVAAVQGIGEVFSDNAAFALLPSVVPKQRIEDANGRLEAAVIVSNEFAGPALGGLLFAIAVALPFSLDAVSFVLAGGLILSLSPQRNGGSEPSTKTIHEDIAEGLRWMWSHTLLRNLSLIAAATNLVLFATFSIQVLFALEILHLSAAGFGLLLSAEAFGAIAGSLVAARIRRRFGIGVAVFVALCVAGIANLVIANADGWLIVGAMSMAVSVGGGIWNIVTNSFRQSVVPDRLLGRVQSSHRVLSWGAMPVGTIFGGVVAHSFGLRAPFLVAGLTLLVLAVVVRAVLGGDQPIPEVAHAQAPPPPPPALRPPPPLSPVYRPEIRLPADEGEPR